MATLSVSNTRINFSKRRPKRLSIRPRREERNLMKHKLQEGWEETSGARGNFKEPVSFFFFTILIFPLKPISLTYRVERQCVLA